ncbi:MAG: hypothetical protein R3228_15505, partial [Halioglobus sp.]|nr:hypothetical protein [Halioglobus sp.]
MKKTNTRPVVQRVIVTMDVDSHLPSTLDLATALAQAKRSTLHGLFIEDEDLLGVAELPFSQEVTLLSGQSRELDNRKLARSLVQVAADYRRALQHHADRQSLEWSFSRVRGRKRALELGEEAGADIVIIAQPVSRRQSARQPRNRFLLALDHSPLALPALEIMLSRCGDNPVELLVFHEDEDLSEEAG